MEQLNLGDAIAQLKVLRLQYFDEITPEEKGQIMMRIFEVIDNLDIPELLGSEFGEL
tara:strand:- start:211 stop:381 length:171 start_codon:yes stop_codon:yes gene_type:complete